jgi:hypothetical protein
MARPLRVLVAGGWYHVMSRGNRRADFAKDVCARAAGDAGEQTEVRRVGRTGRVEWKGYVAAAEAILVRPWGEMVEAHGDMGRDGVLHTATRHGWYRLAEVVPEIPGLKYQAAAQGSRRFQRGALDRFAQATCGQTAEILCVVNIDLTPLPFRKSL